MKVTDEMVRAACKEYDDATDAMSDRASFVGMRAALDALSQPVAEAVAWRSKDYQPWLNGGFAWAFHTNPNDVGPQHEPLYPAPAVAKPGEVMTGAVPDELPEFLEWVASQLLLRDTKAGTFAPGVASSLKGRAYILRATTPRGTGEGA